MKRKTTLLLSLVVALGAASCGASGATSTRTVTENYTEPAKTVTEQATGVPEECRAAALRMFAIAMKENTALGHYTKALQQVFNYQYGAASDSVAKGTRSVKQATRQIDAATPLYSICVNNG